VEIWNDFPLKNVQHEFNPMHHRPVLIKAYRGKEEGLSATDAALECESEAKERNETQAQVLAKFRRNTAKRLNVWRKRHSVEQEVGQPTSIQVPLNDSFAHNDEDDSNDSRSALGNLSRSQRSASSDSAKARSNLLRFTQGRKSFRIVSNNTSPPSPFAPSPRFGLSDIDGSPGSPPYVSHSESGSEVASPYNREENNSLFDGLKTDAMSSSFIGREAFHCKERIASYQLQIRKRAAAFERLQARRQRAMLDMKALQKRKAEVHAAPLDSEAVTSEVVQKENASQQQKAPKASPVSFDLAAKQTGTMASESSIHGRSNSRSKNTKANPTRKESQTELAKRRDREESLRYITALQHRLQDMVISKGGSRLPQLCACAAARVRPQHGNVSSLFASEPVRNRGGDSIGGGAPWEQCANNCRFYCNPHLYARELADLFRSLQL